MRIERTPRLALAAAVVVGLAPAACTRPIQQPRPLEEIYDLADQVNEEADPYEIGTGGGAGAGAGRTSYRRYADQVEPEEPRR